MDANKRNLLENSFDEEQQTKEWKCFPLKRGGPESPSIDF